MPVCCKCNGHTLHMIMQWLLSDEWLISLFFHARGIRFPLIGYKLSSSLHNCFPKYSEWLHTFLTLCILFFCWSDLCNTTGDNKCSKLAPIYFHKLPHARIKFAKPLSKWEKHMCSEFCILLSGMSKCTLCL